MDYKCNIKQREQFEMCISCLLLRQLCALSTIVANSAFLSLLPSAFICWTIISFISNCKATTTTTITAITTSSAGQAKPPTIFRKRKICWASNGSHRNESRDKLRGHFTISSCAAKCAQCPPRMRHLISRSRAHGKVDEHENAK